MTRILGIGAAALVLSFTLAIPAALAQDGFSLKGHLVYNASVTETEVDRGTADEYVGFNVGAEYVLPFGLGFGVSGYTGGDPRDTDAGSVFMVLGEANYFAQLPIPLLPITISPYVGVHTGLGTFSWDTRSDDLEQRPELSAADLGWQFGVRLQITRMFGVDAQYRRMSATSEGTQAGGFEADQILIGVTLF